MRSLGTSRSSLISLAVAGLAMTALLSCDGRVTAPDELEPFRLDARPEQQRLLFDYAGVLLDVEEGTRAYLDRITARYGIESLFLSLPAMPEGHTPETLAAEVVDGWRIGAKHDGQGILLLLADESKQVRLEVGYALEHVFTDGFVGHVEDLQLGPAYRDGDLGIGLLAVMEMLEERARLRHHDLDVRAEIARLDGELLSGGGGATRSLARSQLSRLEGASFERGGPGAGSPDEAWQIMLARWAGEGGSPEVDVYTEMTRIAMGDVDRPDPRTTRWLDHWRQADYQVLREGDHAVIWFGALDGWENAPFLFCDTGEGWKFDIVHQRRLVVMGEAPRWHVARGRYPYLSLLKDASQSWGKDLPLAEQDLYRCRDDAALASRMTELEVALEASPDDIETVLELMRLRVITGQRPKRVRPLLKRARTLAPDRPEPWRYSALYNVHSFFQYRTALRDIERYIELVPTDAYGHATKGFLHARLGESRASIEALERGAELDPASPYIAELLARVHGMRSREAMGE